MVVKLAGRNFEFKSHISSKGGLTDMEEKWAKNNKHYPISNPTYVYYFAALRRGVCILKNSDRI